MCTTKEDNVPKNSFSVCHVNVRSILCTSEGGPSRFELLCDLLVKQNDFDVVALTETHIDSNIDSSLISIDGYSLFRKDRNRSGGGVAMYVKHSLCPKLLFNINKFSSESLFVKTQIGKKSITFGVCYRPPNQLNVDRDSFFDCLTEQLSTVCKNKTNGVTILLGDYNDKCTVWCSDHSQSELGLSLVNLFNEFNMHQMISSPTRGENLLD